MGHYYNETCGIEDSESLSSNSKRENELQEIAKTLSASDLDYLNSYVKNIENLWSVLKPGMIFNIESDGYDFIDAEILSVNQSLKIATVKLLGTGQLTEIKTPPDFVWLENKPSNPIYLKSLT